MLDELISRTITVNDINEAFEAMKSGEVARSVIEYAGAGTDSTASTSGAAEDA
jgi:hypothetical protein